MSILNDIERKRNFEVLNNVRALKLKVKNNKVLGAYCYNKMTKKWFFINAKAVVVATGGFCGIYNFSDFLGIFEIGCEKSMLLIIWLNRRLIYRT